MDGSLTNTEEPRLLVQGSQVPFLTLRFCRYNFITVTDTSEQVISVYLQQLEHWSVLFCSSSGLEQRLKRG